MIEEKLRKRKHKFIPRTNIQNTQTKRNERKITIEGSSVSKLGFFFFLVGFMLVCFFHEVNIDWKIKLRTGIIIKTIILLLGQDYSQSKSYKLNWRVQLPPLRWLRGKSISIAEGSTPIYTLDTGPGSIFWLLDQWFMMNAHEGKMVWLCLKCRRAKPHFLS